jgi:hypothetical protein
MSAAGRLNNERLWENVAGDCEYARSTALNNRCAIYYPQLPGLFLPAKS